MNHILHYRLQETTVIHLAAQDANADNNMQIFIDIYKMYFVFC